MTVLQAHVLWSTIQDTKGVNHDPEGARWLVQVDVDMIQQVDESLPGPRDVGRRWSAVVKATGQERYMTSPAALGPSEVPGSG